MGPARLFLFLKNWRQYTIKGQYGQPSKVIKAQSGKKFQARALT